VVGGTVESIKAEYTVFHLRAIGCW
jgi:hypothetical protein